MARFVEQVIDKDPKTRLFVAEYFQTLSYSENARSRWSKYTNLAQARLQSAIDEERRKRDLEVNIQEIYGRLVDQSTPPEERKSLQSDLLAAKIDIEQARERIALLSPESKGAPNSQFSTNDYDWLSVSAQVQSQAICTSLGAQTRLNSYIQAVARPRLTSTLERYQGGDDAITCNQVCNALDAKQSGATGPSSCFGGIHVYSHTPPLHTV